MSPKFFPVLANISIFYSYGENISENNFEKEKKDKKEKLKSYNF